MSLQYNYNHKGVWRKLCTGREKGMKGNALKYYHWLCLVIRWRLGGFGVFFQTFIGFFNELYYFNEKASKTSRSRIAYLKRMVGRPKKVEPKNQTEGLRVVLPRWSYLLLSLSCFCSLRRVLLMDNFEHE